MRSGNFRCGWSMPAPAIIFLWGAITKRARRKMRPESMGLWLVRDGRVPANVFTSNIRSEGCYSIRQVQSGDSGIRFRPAANLDLVHQSTGGMLLYSVV